MPRTRQADKVVVLGAGADAVFGLPLVSGLSRALADFVANDGKAIDRALRKRVPNVRLSFDKVGADASDNLITRMFEDPSDVVPQLDAFQRRLATLPDGAPVAEVLGLLGEMAKRNEVDPELVARLAAAAGAPQAEGASERVLDPQRLTLSPVVRHAVRSTLPSVLTQPGLSPRERALAEGILAAVSNVEDLLALHFARFLTPNSVVAERRTFVYLAWTLWALLKIRAAQVDRTQHSIYDELTKVSGTIVTFNYTNFFHAQTRARVLHFHGRLDQYLRVDTREILDEPSFANASSPDDIAALFGALRLDVAPDSGEIDLPALVPPTTFKPVLSRAQLRTWAETDIAIDAADRILIVGYSFAQSDEHFNDLLRKSKAVVRVLTRDPDGVLPRAARALGIDARAASRKRGGSIHAGRLSVIGGTAEGLDKDEVRGLLT